MPGPQTTTLKQMIVLKLDKGLMCLQTTRAEKLGENVRGYRHSLEPLLSETPGEDRTDQ